MIKKRKRSDLKVVNVVNGVSRENTRKKKER